MQDNSLLHRQIHPNHVQQGVVSSLAFSLENVQLESNQIASLAFIPSQKDNNKLSVYNGDKFSAEESYDHYSEKFSSAGVLSVTKGECLSVTPLQIEEDNDPFDGHASIDFSDVESKSQIKRKGTELKNKAVKRGWTFKSKSI